MGSDSERWGGIYSEMGRDMERRGGIWIGEKVLGVVRMDMEVCGGTARGGEGQCEVGTDWER